MFRAPVDNDGLKLLADLGEAFGVGAKTLARWRDAGVDRRPADELVEHRHVVETLDDGSQVHTHEVIVPPISTILPGSASRSSCAPGFDRVRWYGRGPLENYPDRNRGALLGIWEAGDRRVAVPRPAGVRSAHRLPVVRVRRRDGATLRLDVLEPTVMHVSATRFTAARISTPRHTRPTCVRAEPSWCTPTSRTVASARPAVAPTCSTATGSVPGTYRFSYRLSLR